MSRSTQGKGLQPLSWLVMPLVFTLAATVLFATPLRVWGLSLPEPVFPMILAFAWAVIRPSILGPFLLLVAGLFLDFFWGGALGLWALCLLLAYGGALLARSLMAGQSTPVLWAWYVAAVALAFGAAYLFVMLDTHVTPDPVSVGLQLAVTAALFPLAARLIARFEDADIRFR